jgi:alkane 1-monooxygenase
MGIMCTNVGPELGHRNNKFNQFIGEILLVKSLNTNFLPDQNVERHTNVAPLNVTATARRNEILFIFWIRSHCSSYIEA